ncbi:MAG: efflux RND transporter periplasmic adaptor subunit [Thermogutta sp.]|nr:efflux RND transporter periplasmic adaptor subunit [Thermogutta sp.]
MNWTWNSLVAAALFTPLFLAGCGSRQGPPPPPTPEVAVVTVQPSRVALTSELQGRTAGYLVAEIRPQVNGLLQKRLFTEGAQVKAGEVLYQIDPAPYQAAVDQAKANLVAARKTADRSRAALQASMAKLQQYQAMLTLARTNLKRYENLLKTQAAAAIQRDQAAAEVETAESTLRAAEAQIQHDREAVAEAEAAIKQAEAALRTAEINLGYTQITAPISGRIGRSNVTEGAIVTAYQPIPLATIQQFDPIYVDVPQSTAQLNELRRNLASGRLKDEGTDKVKIILEDGTTYPLEGSLQFRDVTVDPTMGSVIVRIVVPNPEGVLLPGMFVRAVIAEGVNEHAILVPQQAVMRGPRGNPLAMVVNADGKVEQRALSTERAVGDQWLVSAGLVQGERVIVEGVQKVRPGVAVKAIPFEGELTDAEKPVQTARRVTQSD